MPGCPAGCLPGHACCGRLPSQDTTCNHSPPPDHLPPLAAATHRPSLCASADAASEVGLFKEGGRLVSFLYPAQNKDLVEQLQQKKLTVLGALPSELLLA